MPAADPYYPNLGQIAYGRAPGSVYGMADSEVVTLIKRHSSGIAIDLAAGDGRYVSCFSAERLFIVDIDPNAINALQAKYPVTFPILADLFKPLPFADQSVDSTLCSGLLYLYPVAKLVPVFAEIRRIVRANGYFIFDFATEIERFWSDGRPVQTENETKYSYETGLQAVDHLLQVSGWQAETINTTIIDELTGAGYRIKNRKINVLAADQNISR